MTKPSSAAPGDRVGSRLGGYEIRRRLGSGGMGEVYRARDTRLDRDVALKILSEESALDPARVRRFEREARAASALNHPNIVTVFEVGSAGSIAYIAMELLEGRTLRELTAQGPLPLKSALDIACQVASGLAQAHEAGIIHRDLKPENVMVSKEGVAKILDFGLAKRMPFEADAGSGETTLTHEGSIVGTVSYMSPEQAAGQPVSFRTDQFSFGSILYELVAGARAFQKKSNVETLASIINEPPAPIERATARLPMPVHWVVERCLSKQPADRYASTLDLAQELKTIRDHLGELSGAPVLAGAGRRATPRLLFAGSLAAAMLAGLLGVVLGRRSADRPQPGFQPLTFQRGTVLPARFAPDGRTIVYSASWEGAPVRLFSARTDGRDSTRLDLADAGLAAVSSTGEIAMLLGRPLEPFPMWLGTLATAPLTGGAPREMVEAVAAADWSPDGKGLAVARRVGAVQRIEFPIGKVLYETKGFVEVLRFSPAGDRLAFLLRDGRVSVEVVDLAGAHTVLSKGWKRGSGLAWSPDGREVWFAANESGLRTPLFAVTLAGKSRALLQLPNWIVLLDVSRDGRALVALATIRATIRALPPGEGLERDLSWHDTSMVKSLTPDGKMMLFDEGSEGYFHTVYVRPTDGSPAKRLGEGRAMAISPDGRWVVANVGGRGAKTVLLPTGAGEQRAVEDEGHHFEDAAFFPDGRRIVFIARDPGHADGSYLLNLESHALRPIGPEGVACGAVSPDGRTLACEGPRHEGLLCPVDGGEPRPIPGFKAGEETPLLFGSDGRSLFVAPSERELRRQGFPLKVFRLDLATGARAFWHEFTPWDRAGVQLFNFQLALTPDGRSYAVSILNTPSDLYLVTGLK